MKEHIERLEREVNQLRQQQSSMIDTNDLVLQSEFLYGKDEEGNKKYPNTPSRATLDKWRKRGVISNHKTGGLVYISLKEVYGVYQYQPKQRDGRGRRSKQPKLTP